MKFNLFFQYIWHTWNDIFELILPRQCLLCRQLAQNCSGICAFCQTEFFQIPQHCPRCATFTTPDLIYSYSQQNLRFCGNCLTNPPPFAMTFALTSYTEVIAYIIARLKFQGDLSVASALGHLLTEKIKQHWYLHTKLPDFILPVPLHAKRLQTRGFNQALEIARPISKRLNIPLLTDAVTRIKPTLAQTDLNADQREQNLQGAFVTSYNFSNLHLAIIDDVITTGSTVRILCQLLHYHGARQIDVWCSARRG